MQKSKMKLKLSKQSTKKKKFNHILCNKMQNSENSQSLKPDLKKETIRRISEVQKINTNGVEDSNSSMETKKGNSKLYFEITQTSLRKNTSRSFENEKHNILFGNILRIIVCTVILITFIYNLLSI